MSDNESSAGPAAAIITPQDIRTPRRQAAPGESSRLKSGCLGFAVFLVVVAILAAVGYVGLRMWMAPGEGKPTGRAAVQAPPLPAVTTNTVVVSAEPEMVPAELLLNRERAEEALAEFVKKKNELDELAVLEWGGEEFARVLHLSKQADRHFLEERFPDATRAYGEATGMCDILLGRKSEAIGILLRAGEQALAGGDGVTAKHKFGAALKIDPTHAAAQKGFKRAGTLGQVLQFMESGKEHELHKRFSMAQTDYQEAALLDPDYAEAEESVKRMHDFLRETAFQETMSEGFARLRAGDIPGAEAVFAQASGLKANAPEIKEALLQVGEARKVAKLKVLKADAEQAERVEAWPAAFEKYREALAVDPNLQFARVGKDRAAAIVRLGKHMQYYLDKPDLLSTPQGRTDAALVLEDARAITDPGPTFTALVGKFEGLVKAATTKVRVVLESDGVTSVDVYKVGRFGAFASKTLDLLPGTYTVVGARNGYRDVRIQLNVPAGSDELRTEVKCKEKI